MENNLESFEALIERYEDVTMQEAKSANKIANDNRSAANILTGYGNCRSCTLCNALNKNWNELPSSIECYEQCIHGIVNQDKQEEFFYPCLIDDTYYNIEAAEDCEQLLEAFEARAKYMKSLIKKL